MVPVSHQEYIWVANSNNRKQKEERLYLARMRFCFISKKFGFPPKKHFCVEMQLKVWTENGEFMFNYINWKKLPL